MVKQIGRSRRLVTSLIVFVIAVLALSWVLGALLVRSGRADVEAARPPAEDLTLVTADGLSIAATYRPGRAPDSPGVLLLHGNGASRGQTASNAAWLAGQGYATLAIDFRGHGRSASASHSFGWNEALDARAAFDWLRQKQHHARVAVIGISMGGAAALLGDRGPLPADALVLQAVYPDLRHTIRNRMASMMTRVPADLFEPLLSFQSRPRFGVWPSRLSPLEALRHYEGPVLIIGGTDDPFTPPEETWSLYDAAPGAKTLWFAHGADHEGASDLSTSEYRQQIDLFLKSTIGVP
jgi:alpha-beta hydrolase superfamily lysophospholipase